MPTTAELEARLDALQATRATGTLVVRYADGKSVTYKSDAEMAAAIADLRQQILQAAGVSMVHTIRVGASKGLE